MTLREILMEQEYAKKFLFKRKSVFPLNIKLSGKVNKQNPVWNISENKCLKEWHN